MNSHSFKYHIKKIAETDIRKSIELLSDYFKNNDINSYNSMVSLSARYNNSSRDYNQGFIGYDDLVSERAKIYETLLYLVDNIENEDINYNLENYTIDSKDEKLNYEKKEIIYNKIKKINEEIIEKRIAYARVGGSIKYKKEIQMLEQEKQNLKYQLKRLMKN